MRTEGVDFKSTRKTKPVRISCGYTYVQHVLLFNKAGVEDPREILDRLHDIKFVLVSCDRIFHI
jgi:hypothetical protein